MDSDLKSTNFDNDFDPDVHPACIKQERCHAVQIV